MNEPIDLNSKNVRVFFGRLYNHDYLWFSSSEISKLSTTIPVIHNYALSYALSYFSYGLFIGNSPRYFEDLQSKRMRIYATPAMNIGATRVTITYNALDDLTWMTGSSKANTPNLGKRTYVNPIYERQRQICFHFYAFSLDGEAPPSVIRLGKKGCGCRIKWDEIQNPIATFKDVFVRPTHPVNPLDISGEPNDVELVSIPPHSFFRTVKIRNDWFIEQKGKESHTVLFPKLLRERL